MKKNALLFRDVNRYTNLKNNFELEQELIKDPLNGYLRLHAKINGDTHNYKSSMEEFKGVIHYLLQKIDSQFVKDVCKSPNNKSLQLYRDICKSKLLQLKVKYVNDTNEIELDDDGKPYPHQVLTNGACPYLPSINTITEIVTFFDVFERTTKVLYQKMIDPSNADAKDKIHQLPELYHSNRYYHYVNAQTIDQDFVFLPSACPLGFRDLLRLRAVPLAICGVSDTTLFIDAYANTPLDFYVHDFNHNRRFKSFNDKFIKSYCQENNLEPTFEVKVKIYTQFHNFIEEKVLKPTQTLKALNLTDEEKELRQIMTVLYFELFHEYAFTPDRQSVIDAFRFKPGSKSPFEIMTVKNENSLTKEEIARRRMANQNIQSGVNSAFGAASQNEDVAVHYFFDHGPNFISSAYNKLTHQFYDNRANELPNLPAFAKRTPELIAKAARRIIQDLDLHELTDDPNFSEPALITLAQNKTCIEKYQELPVKVGIKEEVVQEILRFSKQSVPLTRSATVASATKPALLRLSSV